MGRTTIVVALLATAFACETPPSKTAANANANASTDGSGAPWKEVRVAWDFGPCPESGQSCHQMLVVGYDGGFIATETPNEKGAAPVRRFAALDSQEIRELHRVVTAAFVANVGSFACSPEYDATVRIEVEGPHGTRKEEVGGCVHSADARPNAPRSLVQMLEHHRWAAGDAKNTHPMAPSGEGDPCNINVNGGCAQGLVCVVSPCVVAPCVSGSCQKTE